MWWLVAGVTTLVTAMGALIAFRPGFMGSLTRGPVYVEQGMLIGPGGFRYQITNDDMLWLARATWGEAATSMRGGQAVIWAMAQYHALVIGGGSRRPAFSTFTALLRAYCQPINPAWADPNGAMCQRQPGVCSARHIARRQQITNAAWSSIPASVRQLVLEFMRGQLPNPVPGAVDWNNRDWGAQSQIAVTNVEGNYFGVGSSRRLFRD